MNGVWISKFEFQSLNGHLRVVEASMLREELGIVVRVRVLWKEWMKLIKNWWKAWLFDSFFSKELFVFNFEFWKNVSTFSVPKKSMCSKKWAKPWSLIGSYIEPTFTSSAAADLSVVLSEISMTRNPLFNRTPRYSRVSTLGLMILSNILPLQTDGCVAPVLVQSFWLFTIIFRGDIRLFEMAAKKKRKKGLANTNQRHSCSEIVRVWVNSITFEHSRGQRKEPIVWQQPKERSARKVGSSFEKRNLEMVRIEHGNGEQRKRERWHNNQNDKMSKGKPFLLGKRTGIEFHWLTSRKKS